jgi:hypothetical protein
MNFMDRCERVVECKNALQNPLITREKRVMLLEEISLLQGEITLELELDQVSSSSPAQEYSLGVLLTPGLEF